MILHRSAEARVFSLQLGELEATYEHIERLSDLIRDAKTKAENIRQLIEAVEEEERFAAEVRKKKKNEEIDNLIARRSQSLCRTQKYPGTCRP